MRTASFDGTFDGWKRAARGLLRAEVAPGDVMWVKVTDQQNALSFSGEAAAEGGASAHRVPRAFMELALAVSLHASDQKWNLLYRVLWRLTHGEPRLLELPVDEDVIALNHFAKEVKKDAYRMRAFLRFRETKLNGESWFVAWYEPEHDTIALNEEFFVGRFANMRWSILTPKRCMHYDGESVTFSEGVARGTVTEDQIEPLWIAYYSNIFNPARIKPAAMQAQLLKRNWKNLPEAVVIEPLMREARRRSDAMIARSQFLRESGDEVEWRAEIPQGVRNLEDMREAAKTCRGCPLWKTATCTVFGEGPPKARVVLVGEQPGDMEDRAGRPFVGPAGQILDRALAAAGVARSDVYVTNAVKHFKFEPRGKRRIHKTANSREIAACRPWLAAELGVVQPDLIVALGATAARSLFSAPVKVTEERGNVLDSEFGRVLITVHPSSLLRLVEDQDFESEFEKFVADLKKVA
ncbi:MAG TPA: UdgX family uracil-DNA binding protein [Verrucomicrobiae bacterium]|nr:UdgX family uracil-DNA binding protein [Verrucomicrobiae bacterium]